MVVARKERADKRTKVIVENITKVIFCFIYLLLLNNLSFMILQTTLNEMEDVEEPCDQMEGPEGQHDKIN